MPDTTNWKISGGNAVAPTSKSIFWKPSPKGRRRTISIPPCRACSTVINCLSEYKRTYRELSYRPIYNCRLKDQKPVVETFMAWIDKLNASNGSHLAKSLTCAWNQRAYMMTCLKDGICSISKQLKQKFHPPCNRGGGITGCFVIPQPVPMRAWWYILFWKQLG